VSASPSAPTAPRATILLIDDDPFQANVHRAALERDFASIERVADASQAFIRVTEPGFQESLALLVVGLRLPGVAGPAFVSELAARVPRVPILVIGRTGERAQDYCGQRVEFIPEGSRGRDLLIAVRKLLASGLRHVA